MLRVIRRLFSFTDWETSHPRLPPPGAMLDAQFDEITDRLEQWDRRIRAAITEDGRIAPGAVSLDTLASPLATQVATTARDMLRDEMASARATIAEALAAKHAADKAIAEATRVAAKVQQAAADLVNMREAAWRQLDQATEEARRLGASQRATDEDWVNARHGAEGAEANAMLWAQVSQDWAEYMPDTIPPNTLAWMGISGEHWSARWWANRADNAFGRLTDLYLGVHPDPPLTNLEGGAIQEGSIYFDSDDNQMYVFTGGHWQPLWAPQRSVMATLVYVAAASQTAYPLTVSDVDGESYTMDEDTPEAVDVHVNGIRLIQTGVGGVGDYTLDAATSTITLETAPSTGAIVAIDVLMPESRMTNGKVEVFGLVPLVFDGIASTFALLAKDSGQIVDVQKPEELILSIDGVMQEPGADFTASGAEISFATAPSADSRNFLTWYRSMGGA